MTKTEVLSRREIRKNAVQTLFQLDMNAETDIASALNATLALHQEEANLHVTIDDVPYLVVLVNGIEEHKAEIDRKIENQVENWSFTRISKMDLVILRMGVYELFYVSDDDVPKKVAINEAIELAKQFSDGKSPKFINGILSNLWESQQNEG